MNWITFVIEFANSRLLSSLVVACLAVYLGNKYTKIAEERQLQYKRREASAAIVDILAEWVRAS